MLLLRCIIELRPFVHECVITDDRVSLSALYGNGHSINHWNISRYIQLKNDNETLTQSMVNYMASWFSGPGSKSTTVDLDDIEAAADL